MVNVHILSITFCSTPDASPFVPSQYLSMPFFIFHSIAEFRINRTYSTFPTPILFSCCPRCRFSFFTVTYCLRPLPASWRTLYSSFCFTNVFAPFFRQRIRFISTSWTTKSTSWFIEPTIFRDYFIPTMLTDANRLWINSLHLITIPPSVPLSIRLSTYASTTFFIGKVISTPALLATFRAYCRTGLLSEAGAWSAMRSYSVHSG